VESMTTELSILLITLSMGVLQVGIGIVANLSGKELPTF